jgi:hypothetical protein
LEFWGVTQCPDVDEQAHSLFLFLSSGYKNPEATNLPSPFCLFSPSPR